MVIAENLGEKKTTQVNLHKKTLGPLPCQQKPGGNLRLLPSL